MTDLIGRGANQVPVNGMLGNAAFKDIALASSAELTTGTSTKEVTVTPVLLKNAIDYHAGLNNHPIRLNTRFVRDNFTVISGYNACSAGPIEITENISVTIENDAHWSIV